MLPGTFGYQARVQTLFMMSDFFEIVIVIIIIIIIIIIINDQDQSKLQ